MYTNVTKGGKYDNTDHLVKVFCKINIDVGPGHLTEYINNNLFLKKMHKEGFNTEPGINKSTFVIQDMSYLFKLSRCPVTNKHPDSTPKIYSSRAKKYDNIGGNGNV